MSFLERRLATLLAGAALVGCSSDHGLLAQRPAEPPPEGGVVDSGAGNDVFPVPPRNDAAEIDAGDPEPPGPWLLTFVNGLADVDGARFCFVPLVDGNESALASTPIPDAPGLDYGASITISDLGIDLSTTDVHPYLVLGAGGAFATSTCRDLVRGAPKDGGAEAGASPVLLSLPILPAGTLAEARSYLAIASGCAQPFSPPPRPDGGLDASPNDATADSADAFVDDGAAAAAEVCGTGFGATTLGLSLVRMSRLLNYFKLGFQAVNGSNAASPATLLITADVTGNSLFFSDAIELGRITPHAQPGYIERTDFGASLGTATLHVLPPPGTFGFAEYQTDFASVIASGHFREDDITEGHNYTMVMIGPAPGQEAGVRYHPFRVVLVASSPSPPGDDP